MTLLQGTHIIPADTRDGAAIDLEQLAKSHLLQSALERLSERDDLFKIEDNYMGTACRFRAHIFSEAELAEYKNRIISEFLWSSGRCLGSASVRTFTEDNARRTTND